MRKRLAAIVLAVGLLLPFGVATPAEARGLCYHWSTTGWHYTSSNTQHRIDYVGYNSREGYYFKYYSTGYRLSGGWIWDYWNYSRCFYI